MSKSLWLHPKKRPETISLNRFKNYAGFFSSFDQYVIKIPDQVTIRWEPLKQYLMPFEDELDEAPDFIEWVEGYMKHGGDVPPLLIHDWELFDGRHRAWAAWNIGLRRAPILDITEYWRQIKKSS